MTDIKKKFAVDIIDPDATALIQQAQAAARALENAIQQLDKRFDITSDVYFDRRSGDYLFGITFKMQVQIGPVPPPPPRR